MIEQFSVAEVSTPRLTLAEDLAVYVGAEVGGIGISEPKLGPGGDAATIAEFLASGLRATLAVPRVQCILPSPLSPGPADPAARLEQMCASVRRLAAFDPVAIGVQTGPAGTHAPAAARALIVQALRALARTAASLHPRGFQVAIEPVDPSWARHGWSVTSLADAAALIDEAGEPNLRIVLDTWHLADLSEQELEQFSGRIAVVQIACRKAGGPAGSYRALPGHRDSQVGRLVTALTGLGYRGWYELEVPADGGGPDATEQPGRLRAAAAHVRTAQQQFRELHRSVAGVPGR
jgi:sugar phosphate isomerase/epimerase